MNQQHARILRIIADLEEGDQGKEIDEFGVAERCGIASPTTPRHSYVNSPDRARLLHTLTSLEQGGLIYVTKNGHWRLHLTQAGRAKLTTQGPPVAAPVVFPRPLALSPGPMTWEAPRPSSIAPALLPQGEHFFSSLALTIAAVGAVLIFALSQLPQSPLARRGAAGSAAPAPTITLALNNLPAVPPTATPLPPPMPAAPAIGGAKRTFGVANTGGEGVYLRRSPRLDDRLSAWPDDTRLEEIGPETTVDGVVWRHVRAPNGVEGFVPARYTIDKP